MDLHKTAQVMPGMSIWASPAPPSKPGNILGIEFKARDFSGFSKNNLSLSLLSF